MFVWEVLYSDWNQSAIAKYLHRWKHKAKWYVSLREWEITPLENFSPLVLNSFAVLLLSYARTCLYNALNIFFFRKFKTLQIVIETE